MTIDYDRLYEALEWEPVRQDFQGNDIGHCFDFYGWHKHGDRTGKLIFYKEDEKASCFVCGGFTIEHLVSLVKGISDEDADDWLDEFREGYEQSDESFRHEIHEKLTYKYTRKGPNHPIFASGVVERFTPYDEWPPIAVDWARDRGISHQTIELFNVRYGHVRRLPPRGSDEDPYIGDAIIIPHYWNNQLVGWQYRWLANDRPMWLKKYTNTNDLPVEDTVFNYDLASISQEPVFVVESVSTVLWLKSNGFASVATFGAKMTAGKAKVLRRFQQGLILARDNDDPGIQWAKRIRKDCDPFVNIWELPPVVLKGDNDGSDLGDLAPDREALFHHLDLLSNV